jgi:AbrB family looped-hinge helix DNA binding protein
MACGLKEQQHHSVTKKLNEMYSQEASRLDQADHKLQYSSLHKETLTGCRVFLTILVSITETENSMQTTISSKFQVVIPKQVREHLHLQPNQKLTVVEKDGMLIMIPQQPLQALRGIAAGATVADYRDKKDRL